MVRTHWSFLFCPTLLTTSFKWQQMFTSLMISDTCPPSIARKYAEVVGDWGWQVWLPQSTQAHLAPFLFVCLFSSFLYHLQSMSQDTSCSWRCRLYTSITYLSTIHLFGYTACCLQEADFTGKTPTNWEVRDSNLPIKEFKTEDMLM